jgi:hypothetical protein
MPLLPLDSGSFVLGDLLRSDGRTTDPVMEALDLPDPPVWESIPDAGEGRGEEQERGEEERWSRSTYRQLTPAPASEGEEEQGRAAAFTWG